MSSNTNTFYEYEKKNNIFLKRLQEDRQFHDILLSFCGSSGEGAAILVPQSVTLENVEISRSFAETHIIITNPKSKDQFITLNGVHGLIGKERDILNIISGPPPLFDPLSDLKSLFVAHQHLFNSFNPQTRGSETIVVLREGDLDLKLSIHDSDGLFVTEQESTVPLILISEPIKYNGCEWSYVKSTNTKSSGDNILSNSGFGFLRRGNSAANVHNLQNIHNTSTTPPHNPAGLSYYYNRVGNIKDWLHMFGNSGGNQDKAPLFPDSPQNSSSTIAPPNLSNMSSNPIPIPLQGNDLVSIHTSGSFDSLTSLETAHPSLDPQKRQGFFTKLKSPKATDVMKHLKSFVNQFLANPPHSIEVQGQQVRDFISDMENKLYDHPLWKTDLKESLEELENVREGLEKFVMSKIYHVTFAPARAGSKTGPVTKDKDGGLTVVEKPTEQDELLSKQIDSLHFINPTHLDIPKHKINETKISLAKSELKKVNSYKTPRDKMVCIFNCCKVVFSMMTAPNEGSNAPSSCGADEVLPPLIYVVLKANPLMLKSNVDYIAQFRHPSKLITETGYYLTQIVSVIAFVENIEPSRLTISPQEFYRLRSEAPPDSEKDNIVLFTSTLTPPSTSSFLDDFSSVPKIPTSYSAPSSPAHNKLFVNQNPVPVEGKRNSTIITATLPLDVRRQHPFYDMPVSDLKIGDINTLLENYKKLVLENYHLKLRISSRPTSPTINSSPNPSSSLNPSPNASTNPSPTPSPLNNHAFSQNSNSSIINTPQNTPISNNSSSHNTPTFGTLSMFDTQNFNGFPLSNNPPLPPLNLNSIPIQTQTQAQILLQQPKTDNDSSDNLIQF